MSVRRIQIKNYPKHQLKYCVGAPVGGRFHIVMFLYRVSNIYHYYRLIFDYRKHIYRFRPFAKYSFDFWIVRKNSHCWNLFIVDIKNIDIKIYYFRKLQNLFNYLENEVLKI